MRVALLTTSFPLREGSASGVFVQRLVKNLPSSTAVTVITPSDSSAVNGADKFNYKLNCFRYAPRKWQVLAHQPGGIPVALKRNRMLKWLVPVFLFSMFIACLRVAARSDVIHANWSINGAIAGFVGLVLRKPVVTTVRGEDVTRAKDSKIYRYILAWCLRSNCKLVTVSEAIRDLLIREFPQYSHKIAFLPNGVDSILLKCSALAKNYQAEAVLRVVTVGSLIPRKGVDVIIEAFSYLNNRSDFELSVIGDGPELKRLEDLVRSYGLDKQVRFVGHVFPDHVNEYLCGANLLILASYSEGRPNVVLESFAAGVPVIASDIEGVQELVEDGENGLLFKPGDARELTQYLEELQKRPGLQIQFSNQGREFILKNQLLWTKVGQRYSELYKDSIGRKK